jgi:hypothetical protein
MIKNLKMELLNSEQTKEIKGGICEKKAYITECLTIEHKCSCDFEFIDCSVKKYSTSCPKKHDVVFIPADE